VARASVEVVSVELMDAGARVFMNNGMLSASDDGALVSGPGIVTNVGPAYFSVADNHLSTISSEISGPGSLTKAGLGELVLTAANTYGGDTSISNGTLSIAHAYLNDAADVYLIDGVTFDLDFAGIDVIRSLYFDGAQQPAGTYSAGRLNGTIAGTGSLRVTQSAAADGLQFLIR
jgi:autotransporter-associated beta strand protein